jgi:small subunit ribosomal protein S20
MANSRSARKRIRSNERKRIRNRTVRVGVRTAITKARRALLGDSEDAATQVQVAIRALDRAGEKGILHRNSVSRRKSRLASMAARLARAAQGAEVDRSAARSAAAGGTKGRSTRGTGAKKAAAKPAQAGRTASRPSRRTT